MENKLSIGKIVGGIVAAILGIMLISWGLGWIGAPLWVTSAEHVRKQFAFAYQYEESLNATARQYCTARDARDRTEPNSEVHIQRETQVIVIEQNYARIAGEYDAKLRNAYDAKYVAPADVPKRAPTLSEKVAALCGRQ